MDFKPKSISESYYCTTIYYCTNLCSLYSILYIYKSSLYFRSDRLLLQKYLQGSRILVHQWTNVVWIGKLFGDVRAVKQARHTRRHETGRVAGNHRRGDEFRNDRLHAGLCEGRQDRHRDANAPDIGKAAQGIGGNGDGSRREGALADHDPELGISGKFVDHDLGSDQGRYLEAIHRGNPHEPRQWIKDVATDNVEG